MTFTPVTHGWVGTIRGYLPQGFMPYQPEIDPPFCPDAILYNGDIVEVKSAFTRDYLPPDAPLIFYVTSFTTGRSTHVVASDLPLSGAGLSGVVIS
jgi:hypothetical protein